MTPLLSRFILHEYHNTTTTVKSEFADLVCGEIGRKKRALPLVQVTVSSSSDNNVDLPGLRQVDLSLNRQVGYLLPVQRVSRPLDTHEPTNRVVGSSHSRILAEFENQPDEEIGLLHTPLWVPRSPSEDADEKWCNHPKNSRQHRLLTLLLAGCALLHGAAEYYQ